MLTPAKIKNHHFEAAGRNAYKADGVDRFFEEVSASYEQMFRENGEMYKKISLLAERLEEYRNDEDNIRNALLTAQRMSEQIQREAREKADALVSEAQARAVAENARVDAETNEMMAQATYQAQAIVAEAQKQAEKIIYDATHESKEAAISARDWMIKEEAALEMMRVEVSKFKKQILDAYNDQLALIEKLPEIVYAQIDAEKEETAPEAPVEVEDPVAEEPVAVEEPVAAPVAEEPVAVPVFEAAKEEPAESDLSPWVKEEESVNVNTLQQMIEEAEDTDADTDPFIEESVEEEPVMMLDEDEAKEFVLPSVDEASNSELNEMVGYFSTPTERVAEDVPFTKPQQEEKTGFKLNVDKISAFGSVEPEADDADEFDEEFDDDDGEDLAAKFKSFFKK